MSNNITITNLDIIEPHYDFVSCISLTNYESEIKEENVEKWEPLKFWFNRDSRLALPVIWIPFNEIKINVSFTPIDKLFVSREP